MTPRAGCSEWPRSKRWIYHLIEQAARRPSARRFSLWVGAPAAAKLALAVLWMLAYARMTTAFWRGTLQINGCRDDTLPARGPILPISGKEFACDQVSLRPTQTTRPMMWMALGSQSGQLG